MDPGWGFMSMLDRLTEGDITKDKEIYKISWIECMTRLLYWQDKDEWMDKMNKMEESKNKPKQKINYASRR